MLSHSSVRRCGVGVLVVLTALLVCGTPARADVLYKLDSWPPPGNYEIFNNSFTTETESNWVANSFQVVAGGTRLTSFTFLVGQTLTNQSVTAAVYVGSSLTNPNAGGGLTLISTTVTTLTAGGGTFATINLSSPVDLAVGSIFYAALLMPNVPGTLFPFASDHSFTMPGLSPPPLNRSFFDVGPTMGAPYNLNDTHNATVLGGSHPVVDGAQDPGNFVLRVNAITAVPEPASLALAGIGAASLFGFGWRRRK